LTVAEKIRGKLREKAREKAEQKVEEVKEKAEVIDSFIERTIELVDRVFVRYGFRAPERVAQSEGNGWSNKDNEGYD